MDDDERDEPGDPVCWLELVCPDCGAMLTGGAPHRPNCELAQREKENPPPQPEMPS